MVKSERGEALWDEELSLVCTMFVNPKTGTYEPKPSVFAVKEILDPPLKERVYAEATIDLLEFAMQPGRTIKRTLPLAQGKKTLPTHLIFSVRATPLREGVALSEVSSNVSVANLAEVEENAAVAVDQTVAQREQSTTAFEQHTKQVVTTTTEITRGYYDDDGNFVEEDRTREEIVREAMDNTMTAEQREAYDEMRAERTARVTLEEGVRALQESLRPDDDDAGEDDDEDVAIAEEGDAFDVQQPLRADPRLPLANTGRATTTRYNPPVLYDEEVYARAGYTVGLDGARDPLLDVTSGRAFDGHLGAQLERTRLIVGRACKINVRAADNFGNARSTGGDRVEGVLVGPAGEDGEVSVTDHGDGTYGIEFVCVSQGVWTLRLKFNGRLSNQKHELVVSYGPLTASDLVVRSPRGPFLCGGYTDIVIEVKNPELGRVMSGAEVFSVRVISPSAMSMSVPLELETGSTRAVATVCWPEVGAHSVSVSLDGAPLPKCPMSINVLPEDICLAACQIQGSGTHRAIAGERASFVVESHDARGNRLTAGGAPLAVVVRALGDDGPGAVTRGQILDYGNGAYEASYVTRVAGPYEVALVLGTEELVMKGHCEAGRAVVSGCILLGDAVLDLEVGVKGRFSIERRDAYGNRTPSRQGQLALRCSADGPGTVDVHVVDGAEGRSDVVASADVAGRYFLTVVGGDNQDPVPGSPFELVAYPGAAAASASVTSVYGAQLASPDSDVLAAVAGDEITLTVAPRDSYGNQTVFGPGARVSVSAAGGPGALETAFEDRGGPRAEATTRGSLNTAGSYLLSAKVGDEPLAGYPRILQIVPGATDPRRCVLFGEALTGVDCGQESSLTMHAADRFGNLRATGGDVIDLSLLAPDGKTVIAATTTDHGDGTYGASFKLDQAGPWGLQLIVNGRGGRTDVSELTANFGPCKAQDCVFTGFGMDGLEGVTTLTTSRIVISPAAYESSNRRMSGKESISVRVLTPSGGISAVELEFSRGQYVGTYRWIQAGLHTVSVSLDQEAVVGSPFTVEALAALPEIRELESMSGEDITGILQKLDPNASAQALSSLPPEQAAEALMGHNPEAVARMMNGMYPGAVSQVLASLPGASAAAAVSAMSEEKARESLAAMSAADAGKVMASMSPEDLGGKADVLAATLMDMHEEEAAVAVAGMVASASSDPSGVAAVLDNMSPTRVAKALEEMDAETQTKIIARMRPSEAAATMEKMTEESRLEVLINMSDDDVRNLTAGLGAAYVDDKRLPAAMRAKQREEAAARAAALAPGLAKLPPAKLARSLEGADAAQLAGTLVALLDEPAGGHLGLTSGEDGDAKDKSAAAALLRAMPRDKQRDAALELLIAAPEGSAGAILADFTGEEVAAMLAHASAEEHAKLVAELVKEDPEKASDVLAAMPTEKAGAALSVVVARLNNGTGAGLSEAEQFALFVAAPADALKSVDPPTALGTMCASALTPSQAADVLEKLDPNAAAAALEGMSGEEVRQVLEASAMRSVAEGNPASDTPLVAAMVPYMASLDGAGAAAMIEAMPADMAVGVMMNTPETRAKEVLAHTKNTALKERVTNRATMYMPACDIVLPKDDDGRTIAARAGEKYAIQVVARESGGTKIAHGGSHLAAAIHPPGASGGFGEACVVTDLGNGTYDVTVVPTRAGTCTMVLESGSQSRELALLVDAGEAVVSATTFDRSGLDGWRAGEPGVLALKMKDRFGNDVTASSALFTFEGRASGPGGVTVEQSASSDGGALFEFKTTVAGIYKISATCVDTGETAPGLPIDVVMKAGKISHVGCTASLQTITGATKGPGAAAAAFGVAVAMAGEEITCLVDARDRFGNATVWSGESAAVVAHGPAHNPADRAFDVVDVRGGRAGLRGVLPRAGSYTVAVSVDDIPCACSPLVLHVYPGPCETSRASIRGDALSGVLRGAPSLVLVQTEDKFGNNCHGGGDQVDLVLQGPTGARASAVDVVDHGDGTYGCTFVAPAAGRWVMQAAVNGRVAKESTVEVIATYGPLQASDCAIRPGPGLTERATCGTTRDVYLQALEYDVTGRGMSGQEAVTMHLITPSGASHTLSATFAERGSRYRAAVRWWEVGRHEIVATVNGEPVVGSPLVVEVDAQEVSLPMCRLSGQGLAGAAAGERATILIEARDARGNRLFQGGAIIGVAVRVGGETHRGRVQDCGDGTYEASYVVEKAGPYEVSLFIGTEATSFRAVCEPGRVDYTQCRVEGALHGRWIAGNQLSLTVTRADRFGNRVPRREGLAPFHGACTGPGDISCETLELGNGACELRYTGTVAGLYSLGVFVDEQPVATWDENGLENDGLEEENAPKSNPDSRASGATPMKPVESVRVGGMFGKTMFPLPGGQFDLKMEPAAADSTSCDVSIVGASKQDQTWVVAAGDEILVKVIARDRFGNQTHWKEGQNVAVEARGPEYIAFSVTGATGVQADYLARMVRSGTFELRVVVDSLAVCWRAMQVVAGPTYAPRCKISMEGLQGLRTGDTCRLTLKAADQYGNLRLDGNDAIQLTLEGPGGAFARAVQVVDHADGTYALEFITPIAGRWNLSPRVNGKPCVEGGILFNVAFGTLTAEEAVIRLVPSMEDTGGVYECGSTAELVVAGAGFEDNGRLMTGLEAVTVRLLQPSGTQEALPCALNREMTHYVAPIRWLHPGDHAISVLLDGVQVAGTPIRARAEGMEIGLSNCVIEGEGAERCVAGERAVVKLVAKDNSGNPIHRGGAPLMLEARVPGEDPVQAETTDYEDGTYEFGYVVEKAGPLELAIVLSRHSPTVRVVPVTCVAGPMEPTECRVDAGKLMLHWPAGDAGVVRVTRKDRFGNVTRNPGPRNRLAAEVVGPGPCDCEAVELGDGTCELRLRAGAAGSYEVSIVAVAVPNPFGAAGGSVEVGHFAAEVTAGPTFPSACVARMALFASDGAGGYVEESLGEPDADVTLPATVMAGDRVLVYVLPRDSSGNKTRWAGGERIAVSARGPAEIPFEPLDTVGAFAATLTASGAYSVAALVGDSAAAGWPRVLQVVAGPCDPDRCVISGDALGNCKTGTPHALLLQAADRFGNPRSMGGDMIEVYAKPRNGQGAREDADVVDNGDGTYAVTFTLVEATRHDVHCVVNGLGDGESRYFLAPSLAPLAASDCVVRGVHEDAPELCATSTLYVQPANPIRQMSGREALTVTVHTPSGLAFNNPVTFEQRNRRFASPVYWVEEGAHSVAVTLSGQSLSGCPFLVHVRDPDSEDFSRADASGAEFSRAGADARVSTTGSGTAVADATTTTTTTTTITTTGRGKKARTKESRTVEEWVEETFVNEEGVEETRMVKVVSTAGAEDEPARFEFGGGGLKPSAGATERAARSLSGMAPKVAAQALVDMRPAAAGAVLARMDPQTAGGVIDAMEPAVAAAAVCSAEAREAIEALANCPKETRVAVLEAMTPEALGAYLSAMTAEGASDILRELSPRWSNAGVDHMIPRRAADALTQLPDDRTTEALTGIRPKQAAAVLETLCESEEGIRSAVSAMTTLCKRFPDRCAAHVAAMVDVATADSEKGVPGSGRATAHLFARFDEKMQGTILSRLSARQAAYLASNLGPTRAAKAFAAAVVEGGDATGAAFVAAAAESLDEMGWAEDAEGVGKGAAAAAAAAAGEGTSRGAASDVLASMHAEDPVAASGALAALDPALAAEALAALPPQTAADLATGVSDPTVTATLLEEMPIEKRAAMMVKMDPEASAAAASAMDPEVAGEALEAIQIAADGGNRAAEELADAFGAGGLDVDVETDWDSRRRHRGSEASNANAPRALSRAGSDAASDVSSRLSAMMSKMEPFAAAQATSAMDPALANAMQSQLPPDRAAAIISSGGIDVERAAAMLDAMDVDAADKVMAALPPVVAERASEYVVNGEIKARAAARAVVHLESSRVSGAGSETCVAGHDATFTLVSANPGGGLLSKGGAHVLCHLYPLEPPVDETLVDEIPQARLRARRGRLPDAPPTAAAVKDLGNGSYDVRYRLVRAGHYELELSTAGQTRVVVVECAPDELDPKSCEVVAPDPKSRWRAGTPLEVRVVCRDTHGNAVRPPSAEERKAAVANGADGSALVIVAVGEGPGAVEAEVATEGDVAVARFRAHEVGEYELSIFAVEAERQWWGGMQRDPLPGAPLKVRLEAARADTVRCAVSLSGFKERPGGTLVGAAGREATVTIEARDAFGNPAAFSDERLRVDAVGPADVAFAPSGASAAERRFAGALVKSGSYTLRVAVGGRNVAGYPRNLQVVASMTDPTQCRIRGDAMTGVAVGELTRASLTAHDRFGNSCLEGGDQMMVRLLGPAGSVDADVADYGDGTYGLAFTVPRAGEWRAHVAVNGAENPAPLARFTARQGRLTANQMTVKVSNAGAGAAAAVSDFRRGTITATPRVGDETIVYVQALDYEISGREVSGREPVCLRLLSPSGVSASVPLRLSKDNARFRASVRWPEVGPHVLVASLNGDALVGSPAQVSVVAADVHLPVCKVTGAGASRCRAGERAQFTVEARDARGNRLAQGGASLTLQVQAPGQDPARGSVLDRGDGTYTASYAVDVAGPYLLVLASQSSRLALEGVCEPGPADVSRCRVDASDLARLVAGTRGVARVVRADRFGNVIPAGPDMLPFRVEVSGVGPAEVETVEAGDGACEIRFEARVAGRYSLHVYSGFRRDAVAKSPFDVAVLPGQAASSSCVAQLEGTQVYGPGVTAAIAGEALTVRMQARDRFGNATAWKRWQTLAVSASGPQEVVFRESPAESGRGVFVARLSRAGAYVVWCTVGGQAVVGWPRVIQVVPGNVDSDASVWRAEAETMALTSELAQHATDVARGSGPIEAAKMRAEADSLRARLAKYEEAAAVVMEAAEASGVTLVQHARNAAYRTERVEREERVRRVERETTGSGTGSGSLLEPAPEGDWEVAPRGRRRGQAQGQGSAAPGSSAPPEDKL